MTEDFLHYIWKTKQFNLLDLKLVSGESLKIINFGDYNSNAGPDFSEAKIMYNNKIWAGHVELHINSSDWTKHGHSLDKAYNNVVLHVVYQNDVNINYPSGEAMPALELKGLFDEYLYWNYEQLVQGSRFIPCQNNLKNIESFFLTSQYDKWIIERLEKKSNEILSLLKDCNNDWRETFYRRLCFAMGLKVNAEPFLNLSQNLPLKILEKHKSNLFQLEALLFGVAGFLENKPDDDYQEKLKKEYAFLKSKYGLTSLEKVQWKFSRMHPKGFPTIRIAQLAAIIYNQFPDFDEIIGRGNIADVENAFICEPSLYWKTHYLFGKISQDIAKKPGKDLVNRIVINTIVPVMFCYALVKNEAFYKQRVLDLLDQLPKETNAITKRLVSLGFANNNGLDSQALIEMYNTYCRPKKCLNCAIGNRILKVNNDR